MHVCESNIGTGRVRDKPFNYEQLTTREVKGIHISGCRCNERLKAKTDASKRLPAYTKKPLQVLFPAFGAFS